MSASSPHTYAIFSTRYAPLTGGVESFTQRLAHELAAQGDSVCVVTSLLDDSPDHEVQDDGVEVFRLPARGLMGGRFPVSRKNAAYDRLLDELAAKGVDRVLVNNRFYEHSLEGVRFARRIGAPVYVLDHGSAHLTLGNPLLDVAVRRYEHAMTKRMKRLDPHFAGISHASVKWLEHFGIDTDVVIPNAIDVDGFRSIAADYSFREGLGIGGDRKLVAFVGRLEPEKGAYRFAQAMERLDMGYVGVMAGDGRLREQIEALGLANLVVLGSIDQSMLSALLRDADVFCLPTRSEGFCTSLLEAAAQGDVPVMPHVGGTDEVIGYDPVRFGVMLESTQPACVASGIREACGLEGCGDAISEYVARACSWGDTAQALDDAFELLD